MTPSAKLTSSIILLVSGWLLVILGMCLSFTGIGACLGIPMILLGMPLWIAGAVWLYTLRMKRAQDAIAEGVRRGIQAATAPQMPELRREETAPLAQGGIQEAAVQPLPPPSPSASVSELPPEPPGAE